jgi:hypothetical protein
MKQLWQLGALEPADRVRSEGIPSSTVLDVDRVGSDSPIDPITT